MIYTFYSYKGGVGRTHLLTNLAAYLCYYQKRKILMIDWDLEAPGLHFYFGKKNKDIKTKGLIDLLNHFLAQRLAANPENPIKETDLLFPDENYIQNLIKIKEGGQIDLLPATHYEEGYHTHINTFDWLDFYDNQEGGVYLLWLRQQLRSRYDYVFIDSRTGFNDYSGICNVLMPDMNIILVAPNEQNFEGAKTMAKRIINSEFTKTEIREPFVLPILSRLDDESESADTWREKFAREFAFVIPEFEKEIKPFSKEFLEHLSALTTITYNRRFALGEKIHFNKKNPKPLVAGSYLKVFESIALEFLEKMNLKGRINLNELVGDKMILNYKYKLNQNPNDEEACFGLGLTYQELNRLEEATMYYLKAIELNAEMPQVWNNLGLIYEATLKYQQAEEAYLKAIELQAEHYEAWNNLGFLYIIQEQLEKAKECFAKAQEIIHHQNEELLMNFAHIALLEGRESDATQLYQASMEKFPSTNDFFSSMENDFKNLQRKETHQVRYDNIIEKLRSTASSQQAPQAVSSAYTQSTNSSRKNHQSPSLSKKKSH